MSDFVSSSMGRLGFGLPQGFNPTAVYQKRDTVSWDSSTFVVLRDGVTGIEPTDDGVNYRLFAGRGADGSSNAVWHAGTDVTGTGAGIVAGVPGSAAGDMYTNSDTGNVYIATAAGVWDFVRNVNGTDGKDGLTTCVNGIAQVDGEIKLTGKDINVSAENAQSIADALDEIPTAPIPLSWKRGGLNKSNADAAEAREALGLKSGATREIQHGAVSFTMLPNETASVAMTFPTPFLGAPHISLGMNNNTPYNKRISLSNPTATGATFYCDYTGAATGASVTIHWIAAY